jgi:ABC-2 type transport system permease protein
MSATAVLLRFRLRRDRMLMPVWIIVMAFSVLFVAAALASTYNTESLRVAVIRLAAVDPTLLALRGDPDGSSAGAFFMMEIGAYLGILVGFMNTFLAVRHTRADEQAGRAELVLATRARRRAPTPRATGRRCRSSQRSPFPPASTSSTSRPADSTR